MANFTLDPSIESKASVHPQQRIRSLLVKLVIATVLLMAIGSATRVMNAGLACPDWPLCYGTLVPTQQMNLQVFLEWFHRLDASLIGLGAIALATLSWWHRATLPPWLPWATTGSLGIVVFQGVLGGLTVTELLRFDIVAAHLGTALLYFLSLVTLWMMLLPYNGTGAAGKLAWMGAVAAVLVYLQSILGALVASQWAVHQCFGGHQLCGIMNSHIVGVLPPAIATTLLILTARRTPALHPLLRRLTQVASALLILQTLLGVATFWLHLQVEPLTIAHQTIGACLLGTLTAFSTLAWRDRFTVNPERS